MMFTLDNVRHLKTLPLFSPAYAANNVCRNSKSSRAWWNYCDITLWHSFVSAFILVFECDESCGGKERNKRKINNIWANMNTVWTWAPRCWIYGTHFLWWHVGDHRIKTEHHQMLQRSLKNFPHQRTIVVGFRFSWRSFSRNCLASTFYWC